MNFLKTVFFIYLFSTFFNNNCEEYTLFDGTTITKDPQKVLKVLKKIQKQEINCDYISLNLYEFCKNPNLGSMYSSTDQEIYDAFEKYGFIAKSGSKYCLNVDLEYLEIIKNCIFVNQHCLIKWVTLIDPVTGYQQEMPEHYSGHSRYDFDDINPSCVIL